MNTLRKYHRLVAAATVSVVGLVACGDGADTSAKAFCDTNMDLERAFVQSPFEDDTTAEDIKAYYQSEMAPLVSRFQDQAPDDLDADVATMVAVAGEFGTTGNFELFEDPSDAYAAAEDRVEDHLFATCDAEKLEVAAVDYAFQGIPANLEAGRTTIRMVNRSDSEEPHMLGLVRKLQDISLDELLEVPDEDFDQFAEDVGFGYVAAPGDVDVMFFDLEPGQYALACFVSQGSTADTEGDGEPHAYLGMRWEFTVT